MATKTVNVTQIAKLHKELNKAFISKKGESFTDAFSGKIIEIHGKLREASAVDLGTFREHWSFRIKKNHDGALLWGIISNDVPYAAPLVYGSAKGKKPWKSAGPKTVEISGKIYSSQSPYNLVDHVMETVDFADITDLCVDTLNDLL